MLASRFKLMTQLTFGAGSTCDPAIRSRSAGARQ